MLHSLSYLLIRSDLTFFSISQAERAALDARIRAAKKGKVEREASPIVLGPTNGEVIDLTGD